MYLPGQFERGFSQNASEANTLGFRILDKMTFYITGTRQM